MTRRGRYPAEVRERAVRMVFEHEREQSSQWATISSIASKFGITAETLRTWVRRAEVDVRHAAEPAVAAAAQAVASLCSWRSAHARESGVSARCAPAASRPA